MASWYTHRWCYDCGGDANGDKTQRCRPVWARVCIRNAGLMGAVANSVVLAHLTAATLCCGEFCSGCGLQQSLDRLRRMCLDERNTDVMVPRVIASMVIACRLWLNRAHVRHDSNRTDLHRLRLFRGRLWYVVELLCKFLSASDSRGVSWVLMNIQFRSLDAQDLLYGTSVAKMQRSISTPGRR